MADKETSKVAAAAEPEAKPIKAKPTAADWFVVDSNCRPDDGKRVHEQIVDGRKKAYAFEFGAPVKMPAAIAIKFLRDPAFLRTDEKGATLHYERAPKQPEDLGAGEKMILKDSETIARYDELSNTALLQRVVTLPGGEKFGLGNEKPDRAEMVAFIVAFKAMNRKANTSKEADRGRDEFVPMADDQDDEMAA